MKKKIINGILMAAMLFAGTTSFVSCKDNVDDEISGVYQNLDKVRANLQQQIDDAVDRIGVLEGRCDALDDSVKNIRRDLIATQGRVNSLETRMTAAEDSIKSYNNRINAINERIDDLLANALYGVTIEETVDAVIGSINLPGFQPLSLMSYYGLNASGLKEFPTMDPKLHVYFENEDLLNAPNGQYPYTSAYKLYKTEENGPWIGNVKKVKFEGLGAQVSQHANNVGTIYFSMNPKEVDVENITLDIVDSKGNVYPYELSDIKKSTHVLSVTAGKHGEFKYQGENPEATEYLYEAKVHLPMAKWYEAISYNLDDTWKVLGKMSEISDMVQKVKAAKNESGKAEASKVLVKEALQWIQNQYQETYNDKAKMKYQSLQATGKFNKVTAPFDMVVAAVEPLSYKTFWELDRNGKEAIKANVDVEGVEKAVAAALRVIGKKASEIKGGITGSGETITIGTETINTGQLAAGMIKAIIDNLPYANNVLDKLKNVYHAAQNDDTAAIQASVSNFLSKVSAKIASVAGENYFYNIVTPIVLFQGAEGLDRLQPGMSLDILDNEMTVILTSPTEEYLVPAMYKYIAIRKGDKIVEAKILSGQQKVTSLSLPTGDCEIIYQTVDYAGYVVTKSYPVTVTR